jgi:hypothetical protein
MLEAGRSDLIGSGCNCLILAQRPRAALRARIAQAPRELAQGQYVHTIDCRGTPGFSRCPPQSRGSGGYQPHRKSSQRRPR